MTPLKTLLLAPLALFPLLASAATPSFDCHKASGAVETLICKDAKLTALDNELADLYHKALAQLSPEQRKTEQATQRGWIKGRNECWKGQDLRQCVEDNYKLRIAELQVTGGQLMVTAPVFYRCGDQLMLETYFYQDAKVPVAVLNLSEGNRPPLQTIAYQEPSASGARYEGQNISLFTKGDEARLERFGQPALACKVSTAQGK
ncbi:MULTISPECIES: MliC family protein [Aeromonas]|uniref:MliC family protein n=1 Tax=Aeromonas TaxID=642 RepID=UPI001C21A822|nr:MliC family protein [Aeromonas sp. FDAARGOS 1407]QXC35636.1 MliC family protein [Aeromonas sp. FDAARGOS 1407]